MTALDQVTSSNQLTAYLVTQVTPLDKVTCSFRSGDRGFNSVQTLCSTVKCLGLQYVHLQTNFTFISQWEVFSESTDQLLNSPQLWDLLLSATLCQTYSLNICIKNTSLLRLSRGCNSVTLQYFTCVLLMVKYFWQKPLHCKPLHSIPLHSSVYRCIVYRCILYRCIAYRWICSSRMYNRIGSNVEIQTVYGTVYTVVCLFVRVYTV